MSGVIVERPGPLTYRIRLDVDHRVIQRHQDQVRLKTDTGDTDNSAGIGDQVDRSSFTTPMVLPAQPVQSPVVTTTVVPESEGPQTPPVTVATPPVQTLPTPRRYPQRDRKPPEYLKDFCQ